MSPARPTQAQLNIKVPVAFKAAIAADAKKANRTLAAEVVFRCTVKERLKAALAAGEVPEVDPIPEAAPAPVSASAAPQLAGELAAAPENPYLLLKDIHDAVREEDAHCVIPNRLGKRLVEMLRHYHRFSA